MENEKLALEKENLRKVMDYFSVSTELGVVAVNLYGEVFLSGAQYEENTFCQYKKEHMENSVLPLMCW